MYVKSYDNLKIKSLVLVCLLIAIVIVLSISITTTITIGGEQKQYQQQHFAYATSSPSSSLQSGFNFAAVGDWGCTSHTTDTVNNILDKSPELVLGLGDYSYDEDSADCWFDIIQPINNIMNIAIGNHDIMGSILTEIMNHFGLTNQYHSFDYQNVHFTVMADYLPDEIGSEQYRFVQNDLAKAAAAAPNIDWIVIVHHVEQYCLY
jgi:hypothetical protein